MGRPVVHFEILGNDGARLQAFYSELFDWRIDSNNPMNYGIVDTRGEGGINGGISASPEGARVTVYVQVDDLQAHLDAAERLGGRVVMPVTEIPGTVTLAQFADPDGNVIGLVKG
jgi:predicted enzyme related to lactoylglutathione lyase